MRSASSRQPARAPQPNRLQRLTSVASPEPNLPTPSPVPPASNSRPGSLVRDQSRMSGRPLAPGSPVLLLEAGRQSPSKEHDARAPFPVSRLRETGARAPATATLHIQ